MTTTPTQTLFEQLANWAGFRRLQESAPWLPNPLICWGIVVFVTDLFILQIAKEFAGYTATFITNPLWTLQPIFGLVGSVVVVFLHNRYDTVLEEIDVSARTSDPKTFDTLVPQSVRATLYVILAVYSLWQFFINIGMDTVTGVGGLAELIGVGIVLPLGYGVIFSEFLATYIGILLVFPRKIRYSDFELNFLDPEGLGGLRPAGELMKTAYYFIVLGLVGYLGVFYGHGLIAPLTGSPYPTHGVVQNVLFTSVWVLAVVTMVYGLAQIHLFMKRKKRKELARLDRELRDTVDNPFDASAFDIRDKDAYEDVKLRIKYVTKTQEYPTTFSMWVQILLGVVLPKALQVVVTSL